MFNVFDMLLRLAIKLLHLDGRMCLLLEAFPRGFFDTISDSHADFSSLSNAQIDVEIQRTDEAIVKILGVKPKIFR